MQRTSMQRIKGFAINLAVLFGTVIVILLFLEAALRAFPCSFSIAVCDSIMHVPDSYLHHKLIAGIEGRRANPEFITSYKVNSLGMRDKEFYRNCSSIVLLGDSFIEGVGVNYSGTVATQLEGLFKNGNLSVEVWNAGVASYAPSIYYQYTRRMLKKLKPKVLVVFLNTADIQDDYRYESCACFDENATLASFRNCNKATVAERIHRLLRRKSYAYKLFDSLVIAPIFSPAKDYLVDKKDIGTIKDRFFLSREKLNKSYAEKYYNESLGYIKKIKQICDKEGISFILVSYPFGHEASAEEWQKGKLRYRLSNNITYPGLFYKILANWSQQKNIAYLDTSYAFRQYYRDCKKAGECEKLYYAYDGHMTKLGYSILSKALYERFKSDKELLSELRCENKTKTKA